MEIRYPIKNARLVMSMLKIFAWTCVKSSTVASAVAVKGGTALVMEVMRMLKTIVNKHVHSIHVRN